MNAPNDVDVMFDEDFADGLKLGERWQYVEVPGFIANDGEATATAGGRGVSVAPVDRNSTTGKPMFTKDTSGITGHLKWLIVSSAAFPTGSGPLRVRFRAGAQCFGMAEQPYGSAVADPDSDFRLGSATLNVLDFQSGLIFDFWLTNSSIVPFVERMRTPGTPQNYEAFAAVATAIPREPGSLHEFAIVVDAANGTARWEVDGSTVASVSQLGSAPLDWTKVLDHGGTPEAATPLQLQVGIGLMTLLDASLPPATDGLVDIGVHLESPTSFGASGPTLFGQGVQLDVERIVVEPA